MTTVMRGARTNADASLFLRFSQAVPSEIRGHVREVVGLHVGVNKRSLGAGSRLMRDVCKEADRHGKTLVLVPESEGLARWYERFGFVLIQDDPMFMHRVPVPQPEMTA